MSGCPAASASSLVSSLRCERAFSQRKARHPLQRSRVFSSRKDCNSTIPPGNQLRTILFFVNWFSDSNSIFVVADFFLIDSNCWCVQKFNDMPQYMFLRCCLFVPTESQFEFCCVLDHLFMTHMYTCIQDLCDRLRICTCIRLCVCLCMCLYSVILKVVNVFSIDHMI